MTDTTKPSLCLVAHYAYGAISGGTSGYIGGVEWQTSLTARWLAARGYRVSMLTWDEGQADQVEIDGVRVIKMCRRDSGLPGLRFFWPRWTSLVSGLGAADADVYYQNCAEYVTGQVSGWCKRNDRTFVYSVASDPDVQRELPQMHTLRERVLYRRGLKQADRIVVQTTRQQSLLREGFGLDSVVIPMPCPGPTDNEYLARRPEQAQKQQILWIGRICEPKRPDRLLSIAASCPDLSFDLVGPCTGTEYSKSILKRAEGLDNVTVCGPVARADVSKVYQKASCLLCTSDFEGFPNTFLEAWSHGLPIVSTFDPDNVIQRFELGVCSQNEAVAVDGLRRLLTDAPAWARASANARKYYADNHAADVVLPRFEQVFLDCYRTRSHSRENG